MGVSVFEERGVVDTPMHTMDWIPYDSNFGV